MTGCVLILFSLLNTIHYIRLEHFVLFALIAFTFIASYKLFKEGERKLFIWSQLIQALGVTTSSFIFYLFADSFLGPIIGTLHEKVVWGFTFEVPSGVSDFSEGTCDYTFFSFNLIPCAILLYFYYSNKEKDIIY